MATVAWIHVAPVKALAIAALERVTLTERGVEEDRRFCVVDEAGRMLNAKRVPAFLTVRPRLEDGALALALAGGEVRAPIALGERLHVSLYGRRPTARVVEGPFADALSALAGRPVRLVRFDEPGDGVDRAGDGGTASLLSVAALDAMAEAVPADGPVDPRRFRMTFGIAGVPAHEEDAWIGRSVRIGAATVVPVGNVGRCAVTTLDPDRGVRDLDTLGALARYRGASRTTEALPFGVWARVVRPGAVALGDAIAPE